MLLTFYIFTFVAGIPLTTLTQWLIDLTSDTVNTFLWQDGDDGISHEELSTILTSCLESTRTLLLSTLKSEGITGYDFETLDQTGNAVMVSVVVSKYGFN